ncbi:MAG TPA: helix-turn-helix domain-containing protein [Saprospiraceae bacterium]|nr:helix-turn-helix domain-containing protein [Saprospiraceae bacterium]HMQ84558.1 helix-turn-helix domain-containing protein [Saprospiraceae bacterium]
MSAKIMSSTEYKRIMTLIEQFLNKATDGGGFSALSEADTAELKRLSLLAEAWEDSIPLMPIQQPQSLSEMIELKMYLLKLKQKDLAQLLDISPSRLSEILRGKRKINLDLAKRLHEKLDIDAQFILEKA